MQSDKNVELPSNEQEYSQWLLSGRSRSDLIGHVDSGWILNNFAWLHHAKVITRVEYKVEHHLHGPCIIVYIDNGYAVYSCLCGTVFSDAVALAQKYYPELFVQAES